MESHRIAPQGASVRPVTVTSFIPLLMAVLVAVFGVFNFTTVNEAFLIIAISSGVIVLWMIFTKKYHQGAVLNDLVALLVLCWCALICLSAAWAVDRSAAFVSLIGYSTAFFFFFIARALVRTDFNFGVSLLRAVGYVGSLLSLFSIEMASTGLLRALYTGPLRSFFRLTEEDVVNFGKWVEGARMQSILGLPNLYATFAGMCFFLLLWLVLKKRDRKVRPLDMAALMVSGTGFVLSGSRGGLLAFAAAVAVLVLYSNKGERRSALLKTAALTVWCAGTAMLMTRWMGSGSAMVWLVMAIALYLLLYGWHWIAGGLDKLAVMKLKARTLLYVVAGAAVLGAAFLVLALNIRSAFPLYTPEAVLKRAVSLDPGQYTLTPQVDYWDGGQGISVKIESQSTAQAAMQTSEVLYEQSMRGADTVSFTVPDGSSAVFLTLRNPLGGKASIKELNIDGQKIPLEYALIPESVISRLQGIWVDANILQRFVYWRDGLRLFAKSPVIGLGGRAFGATVHGVADYYYVTKHTHNHYVQMMVEGGLLGLFVMLAALALTFIVLWRNRNKLPPGFAPCLSAAVGMMAAHNLSEASMHNLLNAALFFLILGLVSGVCAGEKNVLPTEIPKAAVCVLAALTIALMGGRLFAQSHVRAAEAQGADQALAAYRLAVLCDPLNSSDYKSACLTRYVADPHSGAESLAAKYAADLEKNWNTPRDCFIVGRYNLKRYDAEKAARYFERYIELGRANPNVWNEVLAQYYVRLYPAGGAEVAPDVAPMLPDIQASCERLRLYLDELNQSMAMPVEPSAGLMRVLETA